MWALSSAVARASSALRRSCTSCSLNGRSHLSDSVGPLRGTAAGVPETPGASPVASDSGGSLVASLRTRESSLARTELSSARGGQFHLPPAKQPTDRAYGVRRRRAARPASTHSLTRPPTISTASVTATPGTSRSSASGANSTHQAPAGNRSKPRSPQGEPRLTAAARARQRQQPRVLQHPLSSASSRSRPHEARQRNGEIVRALNTGQRRDRAGPDLQPLSLRHACVHHSLQTRVRSGDRAQADTRKCDGAASYEIRPTFALGRERASGTSRRRPSADTSSTRTPGRGWGPSPVLELWKRSTGRRGSPAR
jgi:hypothetical protein